MDITFDKMTRSILIILTTLICALAALAQPAPETQSKKAPSMKTPEEVFQYIVQNRRDASIVSFTLRQNGSIDPDDPVLLYNAERRFPLASTRKIIHLAAFAIAVSEGRLNPDEIITVADWERFYLPGTDGGAHGAALDYLKIPADEFGFAVDQNAPVKLSQMADVMMRFSDNAAPDWFLERLGDDVNNVIERAQLRSQEPIYYGLGEFLLAGNFEVGLLTGERASQLAVKRRAEIVAESNRLVRAYQDPAWRQAQLLWMLENADKLFNYQAAAVLANSISPKGTALDFARIMGAVITDRFINPRVSALMRKYLETPLDALVDEKERLKVWGFKGGTLAGVQTQASYLIPRAGGFADKPRIVVLFLRNLPEQGFNDLNETQADLYLGLALGTDRRLAATVARLLPRFYF